MGPASNRLAKISSLDILTAGALATGSSLGIAGGYVLAERSSIDF
jgi:hypothetical protein